MGVPIQDLGGNGASGFDGNAGNAEGGSGGGGIVHLYASSPPSIVGSGSIGVSGGNPGANSGSSITVKPGGGGGASGGNGGPGGATNTTPQGGSTGFSLQTVVSNPETFFL